VTLEKLHHLLQHQEKTKYKNIEVHTRTLIVYATVCLNKHSIYYVHSEHTGRRDESFISSSVKKKTFFLVFEKKKKRRHMVFEEKEKKMRQKATEQHRHLSKKKKKMSKQDLEKKANAWLRMKGRTDISSVEYGKKKAFL